MSTPLHAELQVAARAVAIQELYAFGAGRNDPEAYGALQAARARLANIEAALASSEERGASAKVERSVGISREMGARRQEGVASARQGLTAIPTAVAHLLDPQRAPLVEVQLQNLSPDLTWRVRVSTWVEGYTARYVESVEVDPDTTHEPIRQLPTFFPDAIARLNEATLATARVLIEDLSTGQVEVDHSWKTLLLPRTSAIRQLPGGGGAQDVTSWLTAWVTPNAPEVMALLREAAELTPDNRIQGYLSGHSAVEGQVRAIFKAAKKRGIQYVNSVLVSASGPFGGAQRVRLPRESLAMKSANCIDGTVLLASVLEAATLSPAIVVLPGHALLAWEVLEGGGEWRFLETTMLGDHSFEEAVESGRRQVEPYLSSGDASLLQLFKVREQRAAGILPLE